MCLNEWKTVSTIFIRSFDCLNFGATIWHRPYDKTLNNAISLQKTNLPIKIDAFWKWNGPIEKRGRMCWLWDENRRCLSSLPNGCSFARKRDVNHLQMAHPILVKTPYVRTSNRTARCRSNEWNRFNAISFTFAIAFESWNEYPAPML